MLRRHCLNLQTAARNMVPPMPSALSPTTPTFWRDAALPFIEARAIVDGRRVCYDRHAHETFSIGAVTAGRSNYLNGKKQERIGAGTVVLMNPGDIHACNPDGDQQWSYRMLYVDVNWLSALQQEAGLSTDGRFSACAAISSRDPGLFAGLNHLYQVLTDRTADHLLKHSTAVQYFSEVHQTLTPVVTSTPQSGDRLSRAADYISDNFTRALKLEEICTAADLSASYLIRAFNQRYGMTPHAYLLNQRIQYCRTRLARGHAIAEVALAAGFADQAHLQRAFKRMVAATPGQYRKHHN